MFSWEGHKGRLCSVRNEGECSQRWGDGVGQGVYPVISLWQAFALDRSVSAHQHDNLREGLILISSAELCVFEADMLVAIAAKRCSHSSMTVLLLK